MEKLQGIIREEGRVVGICVELKVMELKKPRYRVKGHPHELFEDSRIMADLGWREKIIKPYSKIFDHIRE